jgi:hypothetical protein
MDAGQQTQSKLLKQHKTHQKGKSEKIMFEFMYYYFKYLLVTNQFENYVFTYTISSI